MTSRAADDRVYEHTDPTRRALVEAMRRLNLVVGTTGAEPAALAEATRALTAWADRLDRDRLDTVPAPTYAEAAGAPAYHAMANNPAVPGVPMTFADGEARASLELSEIYQGPRDRAHGGMLSSLMDTLLASLVQQQSLRCVTASLAVEYRAPTPLHRRLDLHGWMLGVAGRTVRAAGTITVDGRVTVEATGVFVKVAER